ncbi:reverse transcriptase domain-containing protein [Tanacetum coccineum]
MVTSHRKEKSESEQHPLHMRRVPYIDEVTEQELDALLDDSKRFFTTSKNISESSLDHEFKEFMAIKIEEIPEQEEEIENSFEYLEYTFLEKDSLLLVVISALLQDDEKKRLVFVLKKHKEAFAWKTSDISGISPSFCKHKINFKDDAKPVIQRQRRLNLNMKEVVKKEIIKLLDAGIIYAIEESPWVSLVHYVPKKGGITVVTNEKNELVPTRTVTGWRVCIDYCKLNEATRKDHFPLPFMDQMLERLAGNRFFYFLDGFSGYFQILIEPADQENTTFTCPYGTYAYKRIPFGLFNVTATFQRCMIAIFQDMLETSMEVFMDDFLEKCHFMATKGIVLGHKVSSAGLEVDKAKIDVITKLPPSTNVKSELRNDDIDDNFPDETLMNISSTDFANYLVGKILRKGLTYAQGCKFFSELKHYLWDKPYIFKICMIWRCVYGAKTQKILNECHHGPAGGHYGPSTTAKKAFDADFYWLTIFKEARTLVQNCDTYQRSGSL